MTLWNPETTYPSIPPHFKDGRVGHDGLPLTVKSDVGVVPVVEQFLHFGHELGLGNVHVVAETNQ